MDGWPLIGRCGVLVDRISNAFCAMTSRDAFAFLRASTSLISSGDNISFVEMLTEKRIGLVIIPIDLVNNVLINFKWKYLCYDFTFLNIWIIDAFISKNLP